MVVLGSDFAWESDPQARPRQDVALARVPQVIRLHGRLTPEGEAAFREWCRNTGQVGISLPFERLQALLGQPVFTRDLTLEHAWPAHEPRLYREHNGQYEVGHFKRTEAHILGRRVPTLTWQPTVCSEEETERLMYGRWNPDEALFQRRLLRHQELAYADWTAGHEAEPAPGTVDIDDWQPTMRHTHGHTVAGLHEREGHAHSHAFDGLRELMASVGRAPASGNEQVYPPTYFPRYRAGPIPLRLPSAPQEVSKPARHGQRWPEQLLRLALFPLAWAGLSGRMFHVKPQPKPAGPRSGLGPDVPYVRHDLIEQTAIPMLGLDDDEYEDEGECPDYAYFTAAERTAYRHAWERHGSAYTAVGFSRDGYCGICGDCLICRFYRCEGTACRERWAGYWREHQQRQHARRTATKRLIHVTATVAAYRSWRGRWRLPRLWWRAGWRRLGSWHAQLQRNHAAAAHPARSLFARFARQAKARPATPEP